MARRIILASQSPRRKMLLQQAGLVFDVCAANIDESVLVHENAEQYACRVAKNKAQHIISNYPDSIVIAADTVVEAPDGQILTKPQDLADAMRMWRLLAGNAHQVKTAVVITDGIAEQQFYTQCVNTTVYFKDLTDEEMIAYWQSGEPQDKAGGYAIQGIAGAWVIRIDGSYSNVVGLPLYETLQLLRQIQP